MPAYSRGKKKKKKISRINAQTNLYEDDEKEIQSGGEATGRKRADVLRDYMAAGVRAKRLHRVGNDEAMSDVINAQRSVVSAGNEPLVTALKDQQKVVEAAVRQMGEEYASIEERLKRIENALVFIIKGFDRILENIVLIRSLIWFYVFDFYYTVMVSAGQRLTREQLRENYEGRIRDIKTAVTKYSTLTTEEAMESTVATVGKNLREEAINPPLHRPQKLP